jgi:c-di-GMP-binding flagellar brake protein YcgR
MHNEIISIGDKIDIKPLDNEGKPVHGARTFASQLVNIESSDTIHITAPIVHNKIMVLNVGRYFNLCFYTAKGLYQCNCVVLSNYKDNKTVVSEVRLTSKLEKFQRRQYYRLECIHDIEYRMISIDEENQLKEHDSNDHNKENANKYTWIKGAVIDISGGGARMSSAVEQKKGDQIKIKLELVIGNNLRCMELDAVVVASAKVMNRRDVFEHRVQFNNISHKDRDDLIKYIFEQDRRRRKNDKTD